MLLSVRVRDLLLASWRVPEADVARVLAPGLRPAAVDGEHLVSAVSFRYAGGRLGRLPVPPFAELNLRTYTAWDGELAAYFLDVRVTLPGKPAALFLPVRTTRLRVERGLAEGMGLRLRYEVGAPVDPGALGRLELGLFPVRGLSAVRVRRGPADWRLAHPVGPAGLDPVLALGFDVGEPDELLYVEETTLETALPPERLAPPQ